MSAWRGESSEIDAEEEIEELEMTEEDGQLVWSGKKHHKKHNKKHDKKHSKKGKKWDPETQKERLTNALMYMHSRGELTRPFSSTNGADL